MIVDDKLTFRKSWQEEERQAGMTPLGSGGINILAAGNRGQGAKKGYGNVHLYATSAAGKPEIIAKDTFDTGISLN